MSAETERQQDAGAHTLYGLHAGGFECCACDLRFDSYEAARLRPCVSFGAWD